MKLTRRGALACASSLAVAGFARKPSAAEATPKVGQLQVVDPPRALPDLHLTSGDGTTHHLTDYAGQGIVLNFWATWCGPCVAEMPSLATLAPQLAPAHIVVLPVCTDTGGATAVSGFYQAHHVTGLGIFLDPDGKAMEAIGALGLPTTLIIDRHGREVARMEGGADWAKPGTAATISALCAL
jgi:thiol-disulfide isomerase/thioredoxin